MNNNHDQLHPVICYDHGNKKPYFFVLFNNDNESRFMSDLYHTEREVKKQMNHFMEKLGGRANLTYYELIDIYKGNRNDIL